MAKNDLQVVTPVKSEQLRKLLKGYDLNKLNFLCDGFQNGFFIPFEGTETFRSSSNLKSAIENQEILRQKIAKEIHLGRVAGPFIDPPFKNFISSPLGLVPKNNSDEFRTIHHLSYPKGNSVNDGVPEEYRTVQYQSIDDAVGLMLKYGRFCYFAKTDIKNAYKIVPIHPSSHHLLGFSFDNQYYYDKTLPMGLSYSCNLFEQFSTALQWIALHKLGIHDCVHVLDDFLFVSPPPAILCKSDLEKFFGNVSFIRGSHKRRKNSLSHNNHYISGPGVRFQKNGSKTSSR